MRRFVIIAITIAAVTLPISVHAGAIWRIEATAIELPTTEETGFARFLTVFRGWIAGRTYLRPEPGTTFVVTSSAYAPSPYQTDATPCITAAGTRVRDGVVASNFLPLGTILTINGKYHIVEDRMNPRFQGKFIDIWFPSTASALEHGRQTLEVTIIGYGTPGQNLSDLADSLGEENEDNQANQGNEENLNLNPNILTRVTLQLTSFSRNFSKFIKSSVSDRNDIDCFADESAPPL